MHVCVSHSRWQPMYHEPSGTLLYITHHTTAHPYTSLAVSLCVPHVPVYAGHSVGAPCRALGALCGGVGVRCQ
jgi:hypothetical protein